jgi:hypothetical protein
MQQFGAVARKEALALLLALFFLVSNLSSHFPAGADSINPGVFSKDSSPYNIPYAEWVSKWWQWTMGIPSGQHPRENYDPMKCGNNQSGPVWFLADGLSGKEERTCTIPAGKAILVPLLTGNCHNDGVPQPMNDQELKTCAMAGDEYGVISATSDGKPLKNLQQYRTQTPFYNITVPKDNIYENKEGVYRAFADGFFVFLEPLPEGRHDLTLKTNVQNPNVPDYNYSAEVVYHLIVGG